MLARRALFLQTIAFVHNLGELPIRRPNRAPPAATKDGPRTNDEIRNAQVQLIDQDGTNHGTVETAAAVKMALEAGMDLVEISPNTNPPVCKIMDYGKFKYSAQKKAAEARKKQKVVQEARERHGADLRKLREVEGSDRLDRARELIKLVSAEMKHAFAEILSPEQDARFEGRQVVMVLAPR